ncbi:YchJ family protein [Colwellia sp. UCD-KL20]|uniref:YchJ family protein n=1 Tax=Colwellia sp. UCD-KL20 TaxID=1917165 RepID=UPI00097072CA|nr:YchJ family protein [Colwellia sp. UCD-KL20]
MLCPCGSNTEYKKCCEPLILKKINAESPEQLMRSRYSAYALKHSEYIYETYSNASKKLQSLKDIAIWAKQTDWLNLRILNTSEYEHNSTPTVTFEALYKNNGIFYKMSEKSAFIKEEGFWRYVDGSQVNFNELAMPKRNDECFCLSGKKYKKCCAK